MKLLDNIKVLTVSISSISGIQLLEIWRNIQPDISFIIQVCIGLLTIVYLIQKIRKKND